MSETVKTGVIGLGRSGWSIHALGLAEHDKFEVAAVVDPEADRRREAEEQFGCKAYATPEELFADDDVELVVVATPSHTHAPLSIAALEAGKNVLVEKPMASDAKEADAMIEAARASGKLLTVYQCRRVDADFLKMQEIIASGVLGPLHLIKTGAYGYQRRNDWQTLRKYSGGVLNNTGAHNVDQALLLAGYEWQDLFADLRLVASAGDAEDHAKVVFKGKNGVTVDIELTTVRAFSFPRWIIMGKYGSLVERGNQLELKYYDADALPAPQVKDGPAAGRQYGSGETIPWKEETIEITPNDTRALFYSDLYESLRHGKPLLTPPEQVRTQIALLEACHRQAGI
jgi:predicted dehydrogenase